MIGLIAIVIGVVVIGRHPALPGSTGTGGTTDTDTDTDTGSGTGDPSDTG